MKHNRNTSWEKDRRWYSRSTRDAGSYFHEHVVIPNAKRLLGLKPDSKLLDLGCGSGVLGRAISPDISYTGIDLSGGLIEDAARSDHAAGHRYITADVTRKMTVPEDFTHAAFILSLQNMKDQDAAIINAGRHLAAGGVLVIVLNHPAFRIPRQSSWGTDEKNKLQYRRVNRYLSPLEIPITMHPGKPNSTVTWTYHQPISAYARMLKRTGFVIENMEEWASDKKSYGDNAKPENRARSEFPLFLAIKAFKTAQSPSP